MSAEVKSQKGKTSSTKYNSGRKSKMTDRDKGGLKLIVAITHETKASRKAAEMNTHQQEAVSVKTIRSKLNEANIHARAVILKPLVTSHNS